VYEASGQPVPGAELRLDARLLEAQETDLLENAQRELPVEDKTLRFDLGPFEVKTFRLRLGPRG
jgi:alpha-mannosidase